MSQPEEQQDVPGTRARPVRGKESYRGSDRLTGKPAVITGGDGAAASDQRGYRAGAGGWPVL